MNYVIFNNYVSEPIDVYTLIDTNREIKKLSERNETNVYIDIIPPPENRPVRFYCEG